LYVQESDLFDAQAVVVQEARTSTVWSSTRFFLHSKLVNECGETLLCHACAEMVTKSVRPLDNVFFKDFGNPHVLPRLSLMEKQVVALSLRFQPCTKFHGSHAATGAICVKGHVIVFGHEGSTVLSQDVVLPRLIDDRHFLVAFVGPKTMWRSITAAGSTRGQFIEQHHQLVGIDAGRIFKFLEIKKQLDPAYRDVVVQDTPQIRSRLAAICDEFLDNALLVDDEATIRQEVAITDTVGTHRSTDPAAAASMEHHITNELAADMDTDSARPQTSATDMDIDNEQCASSPANVHTAAGVDDTELKERVVPATTPGNAASSPGGFRGFMRPTQLAPLDCDQAQPRLPLDDHFRRALIRIAVMAAAADAPALVAPSFFRHDTVGGGDCAVASILQAVHPLFRHMQRQQQIAELNLFRSRVLRKFYSREIHALVLPEAADALVPNHSYAATRKQVTTPLTCLSDEGVQVVAAFFGIDIITVRFAETTGEINCYCPARFARRRADFLQCGHDYGQYPLDGTTVIIYLRDAAIRGVGIGAGAGHYETVSTADDVFVFSADAHPWLAVLQDHFDDRMILPVVFNPPSSSMENNEHKSVTSGGGSTQSGNTVAGVPDATAAVESSGLQGVFVQRTVDPAAAMTAAELIATVRASLAPPTVSIPVHNEPLNEFASNHTIIAGGFPHLFVLGHPYGMCTGPLTNPQIQHLIKQYDQRYAPVLCSYVLL